MEESSSSLTPFQLLVITLIAIALTKFASIVYKQLTYWRKLGVPHINAIPVLGTAWRVIVCRASFFSYIKLIYDSYPYARYVGIMDFATPTFAIRDPELIKELAIKNFDRLPNHRSFVTEEMDPIFGRNVFSLKDDRWRKMRQTLSPFFTSSKMKFMFDVVSKSSRDFVGYLHDHPESCSTIEAKSTLTRYTNDVIATVAFGIGVNSMRDRDNEFYRVGGEVTNFSSLSRRLKFLLYRLSPRLTRIIGITWLSRGAKSFLWNVISETVKIREEKNIVRADMIQLLIQARDKESPSNHRLLVDDIVAQAFIFFLAGFDTSSTLMSCLLYELALNQDIQEKLRKEVDEYLAEGNGEISYESLIKMEYMEMVICETLRKYPPVFAIDRVCVEKFELPPAAPGCKSVTVNPGDNVWYLALGLHYDPKYFPNPEIFDPERFSEENKNKIDPYAYFPFGLGPRKCIGNRFALMETKILIVHILQKFLIKSTEKTKPIVCELGSFQIATKDGFWIRLEKRVP